MDILQTLKGEIEGLHIFFEEWFSGRCDQADFEGRFDHRFDSKTVLVQPGGQLYARDEFREAVRSAHGTNPDFRIQIRNVTIHREKGDLFLVTYEEWQRNALASKPPDNGRLSSVLFDMSTGSPVWLHIHETWLPEAVIQSDEFDF